MRIAAFSDIHGNLSALESVLKDINGRDIDMQFCLGDLVGYGAYPNEVIKFLRANHVPTIMGNYDDGVGYDRETCGCAYKTQNDIELGDRSFAWTKGHVTPENKAYLRGLPHRLGFNIYDKKVLLVHGSPRKINEYLFENRPDESILRIMDGENVDLLICGHTHFPYVKNLRGKCLINSGSVGKPKDGDTRAGYVIVGITEDSVEAETIRVPYDIEAMAKAIEATDLPHEFADALRYAKS
jgi:putative phosphoesterase